MPSSIDNLSTAVAQSIREQVVSGRLQVGDRLPAEPDLARQHGVSRATLREALKTLEQEGIVVRRQRVGTRVCARPAVSHPLQRNSGFRELIEASGKRHSVDAARIEFITAPDAVISALSLGAEPSVAVLERVRAANGVPVILTIDYLPVATVKDADASLLPDVSLYEWLATHADIKVAYGVAQLKPAAANDQIAKQLQIDLGTPLLHLLQTDYSADGQAVLYSEEWHVAEAFELSVIRNGPFRPDHAGTAFG